IDLVQLVKPTPLSTIAIERRNSTPITNLKELFLMNAIIGICGIVMLGWVSPEYGELVSQPREKLPIQPTYSQQAYPQTVGTRPTQSINGGVRRRPKMPLAPTDPRAYISDDLPLPPTMNDDSIVSGAMRAGPEPRFIPAGLAENRNRRLPNQKPFSQYNSGPGVSPYNLLNAGTNDGTVSTYMSYVRPAQD